MTPIERLERLLETMVATQGEDSEYVEDVRVAIAAINELENIVDWYQNYTPEEK
jgi:hypothetical protein